MSTHASSPQELLENLKSAMPDDRWRMILQTLAIKGIADTRQLQDATNFGRDKVMRILDRLAGMSLEGFPILSKLLKTIERSGEANRPPAIYILEEGGARLEDPSVFRRPKPSASRTRSPSHMFYPWYRSISWPTD